MIFKFIKRDLTGAINVVGGKRGQSNGQNSSCITIINQNFNEKMLLNSLWCLTVSSVTFMLYNKLYNNPTLNNYFHINQKSNQLIKNQMDKEVFKSS